MPAQATASDTDDAPGLVRTISSMAFYGTLFVVVGGLSLVLFASTPIVLYELVAAPFLGLPHGFVFLSVLGIAIVVGPAVAEERLKGELPRASDVPEDVVATLYLLSGLYYSTIVVLATVAGLAVSQGLGAVQVSFFVALLYPVLDLKLADLGVSPAAWTVRWLFVEDEPEPAGTREDGKPTPIARLYEWLGSPEFARRAVLH